MSVPNRILMNTSRQSLREASRSQRGFTMMEVMVVIAIIVIIAGVAFVSISQIQKNMQQKELDETAREIFIAAQNHLSSAEAEGLLFTGSGSPKLTLGYKETTFNTTSGDPDVYLFAVPQDDVNGSGSVLSQMLPYGSIDETIRTGGTYVIRYNAKTATVLDVFYTRLHNKSLFGASNDGSVSFSSSDYYALFVKPDYRDDPNAANNTAKKELRQNYNETGVIIGYYGGAKAGLKSGKLGTLKLSVTNAERLVAKVTYKPGADDATMKPSIRLVVKGLTSGKTKTLVLTANGTVLANGGIVTQSTVSASGPSEYTVVLDDITTQNKHFSTIFNTSDDNSGPLLPGENVQIQAVASSSQGLAKVVKSSRVIRNSLFASVTPVSGVQVANISNIRHLENLSGISATDDTNNISNFNVGDATWKKDKAGKAPTYARQTTDISWDDFCEKIHSATGVDKDKVQIYRASDTSKSVNAASSFVPVAPKFNLVYEGGTHAVSDIIVNITGKETANAGLFATLNNGSVSNLELVNFQITTKNGNAGALAGNTSGTAVNNVLARDDADSAKNGISTGAGDAGGLVGAMSGGSMTACAAAVYVSGTSYAGGLVGSANDTTFQFSYSGGHTHNGKYDSGRYASNVSATGIAGGFAGSLSGKSVTSCYTTCSASGSTVGGFAGDNSATLSDCYAVGAVSGTNAQPFTGNDVGSGYHFETVNGVTGWSAIDQSSYDTVFGKMTPAVPYDATLISEYGGKYSFKTVKEMGAPTDTPNALTKHLSAHYGDWPDIVTLVVND